MSKLAIALSLIAISIAILAMTTQTDPDSDGGEILMPTSQPLVSSGQSDRKRAPKIEAIEIDSPPNGQPIKTSDARFSRLRATIAELDLRISELEAQQQESDMKWRKQLSYSAAQALGAPDTPGPGDSIKAWATKVANRGEEWLEVSFNDAQGSEGVVIYESFSPGAIVEISIAPETDLEVADWELIWSGNGFPIPETSRELHVELYGTPSVGAIRIVLDTASVPGWNEIDAVGRINGDIVKWATRARASSEYGR